MTGLRWLHLTLFTYFMNPLYHLIFDAKWTEVDPQWTEVDAKWTASRPRFAPSPGGPSKQRFVTKF